MTWSRLKVIPVADPVPFACNSGVLAKAAAHVGLPRHDFKFDRPQQHTTEGKCPKLNRTGDPDFFGEGGR